MLDCESDIGESSVAVLVMKVNFSLANFVWLEDVLLKFNIDARSTLVHTAPGSDLIL